jgi:hypothetical protein
MTASEVITQRRRTGLVPQSESRDSQQLALEHRKVANREETVRAIGHCEVRVSRKLEGGAGAHTEAASPLTWGSCIALPITRI